MPASPVLACRAVHGSRQGTQCLSPHPSKACNPACCQPAARQTVMRRCCFCGSGTACSTSLACAAGEIPGVIPGTRLGTHNSSSSSSSSSSKPVQQGLPSHRCLVSRWHQAALLLRAGRRSPNPRPPTTPGSEAVPGLFPTHRHLQPQRRRLLTPLCSSLPMPGAFLLAKSHSSGDLQLRLMRGSTCSWLCKVTASTPKGLPLASLSHCTRHLRLFAAGQASLHDSQCVFVYVCDVAGREAALPMAWPPSRRYVAPKTLSCRG
jgi:hypothetical protein